jgi:hypothetical protein
VISLGETVDTAALAIMQMARKTGDRYRDVSPACRDKAVAWLQRSGASPHFAVLVEQVGQLERQEQSLVFGESLPRGLRISG